MLRLLKVKELEDRRRVLLARSDVYRRTLILEVANIKQSVALLEARRVQVCIIPPLALFGLAVPIGRWFLFGPRRSRKSKQGRGFISSKLLSGVQVASSIAVHL